MKRLAPMSAKQTPPPHTFREKTIGDTTYFVENVMSPHARETAYDKVKRLILHDVEGSEKQLVS